MKKQTSIPCKFLRALHKRYGRIVVFTYNASIHKVRDVMTFVKKCKGDVIFKYYLPYTPQLNKTENPWLNVRRYTANTLFESLDECKKFIRKDLDSGMIKIVEMSEFLVTDQVSEAL